jgi:hypothetical protein
MVKHRQTQEGTQKQDVKPILPLLNAVVTKGKKSKGKKIEQWNTVKFRKLETEVESKPHW